MQTLKFRFIFSHILVRPLVLISHSVGYLFHLFGVTLENLDYGFVTSGFYIHEKC